MVDQERLADPDHPWQLTPRSTTLLALAKLSNLSLRIELCEYNPLGRAPTFVGADGFVLSECIPLTLHYEGDSLRMMLERCNYLDENLKRSNGLFTASLLMGAFAAFRKAMHERVESMCSWYEAVSEVDLFKEVAGGVPDLGLEFEIPGDTAW
ncbi:hypothetical protein BDW66DRAFT_157407 [Aspergillus desertorum]